MYEPMVLGADIDLHDLVRIANKRGEAIKKYEELFEGQRRLFDDTFAKSKEQIAQTVEIAEKLLTALNMARERIVELEAEVKALRGER